MKSFVSFFKSGPKRKLTKREDKRSINLPWNSRFFFQVGLIVSLLAVFFIMESTLGQTKTYSAKKVRPMLFDPPVTTYVVEKPVEIPAPKQEVVKKQLPLKEKIITSTVKVIEDPTKFIETPVASTETPAPSEPVVDNTPAVPVKKSGPENVNSVEFVPVFPGCESLLTNNERKECMSSKIREFIAKEFKSDKFSHMDSGKSHRIGVQFKIDANGAITEIVARAPDAALEKEAQRVIAKLPRMKPGKQGTLPVEVMYTIPIVFQTN